MAFLNFIYTEYNMKIDFMVFQHHRMYILSNEPAACFKSKHVIYIVLLDANSHELFIIIYQ